MDELQQHTEKAQVWFKPFSYNIRWRIPDTYQSSRLGFLDDAEVGSFW